MNINKLLRVAAQINLTALPPKQPATRPAAGKKDRKDQNRSWPDRKLAEFEIEFVDGFLANHTLRGFTLWRRDQDGELFVTGPQRAYKKDGEDHYYQFLVGKTRLVREQFADFFIAEYRRVIADQAEPAAAAGPADDPE